MTGLSCQFRGKGSNISRLEDVMIKHIKEIHEEYTQKHLNNEDEEKTVRKRVGGLVRTDIGEQMFRPQKRE